MTMTQRVTWVREKKLDDPTTSSIELHNQFVEEQLYRQALITRDYRGMQKIVRRNQE